MSQALFIQGQYIEYCKLYKTSPLDSIIQILSNAYANKANKIHLELVDQGLNLTNFKPVLALLKKFPEHLIGLDISLNDFIMDTAVNQLTQINFGAIQLLSLEKIGVKSPQILSSLLSSLLKTSNNLILLNLSQLPCLNDTVVRTFISSLKKLEENKYS